MRSRSISLIGIVLLTISLLAPAGFLSTSALALQSDGESPTIEPADEDSLNEEATEEPTQQPTEEASEEPAGDGLQLQFVEDLGNGGQPEDLPREIVVGDSRFLFDRFSPASLLDLTPVATSGSNIAYATTADAPFSAIYLSAPPLSEDELARYLPESLDAPETACVSDNATFSTITVGDALYVFAGVESDLTPDALQEVGTSDGQPVYADPDMEQPFPELFFDSSGLQRFILTTDGRPVSLAESLAVDGVLFAFSGDVTGSIDSGSLAKIGCAGPFTVFTSSAATEGDRFVSVVDRLFQYSGETPVTEEPTSEPAATEEPTEVPTEEPTQEPTEVPTEEPTQEPTEVPTEVPTQEPTLIPTEEPTQIPTELPTDVPTEVPTLAPTEVPTQEPTEIPTEQPTEVPTNGPTEQPTDVPTPEPTSIPTQVPATEAPVVEPTFTPVPTQQPQAPAIVPTLAPNVPPPAAVTAEPGINCFGSVGALNDQGIPVNLPTRIQYGGIAYAFASTQPLSEVGELTAIGCAGPFEVATSDGTVRNEAIYLRATGTGSNTDVVYRFEAGVTYDVEFEVTGRAQRIQAGDQTFQLTDAWVPSIYSSTTVILFVNDTEEPTPATIYAVNVNNSASGDIVGEYRRLDGNENTNDSDLPVVPEGVTLQPDLTIEGTRYVLVNVFLPVGTTTNGFVTVFSANGEGTADLLLGRDLRRLELFLYTPIASPPGG